MSTIFIQAEKDFRQAGSWYRGVSGSIVEKQGTNGGTEMRCIFTATMAVMELVADVSQAVSLARQAVEMIAAALGLPMLYGQDLNDAIYHWNDVVAKSPEQVSEALLRAAQLEESRPFAGLS